MGIQRRTNVPAGIVNESGQPEIVLEIEGLTVTAAPPAKADRDAAPQPDGTHKPVV